MSTVTEFVPHQPGWARRAVREMARVEKALGAGCVAVHHLGSTSVPGLAAVPVIDLGLAVGAFSVLEQARLRLMAHGFQAAERSERPMYQVRCPLTREVHVELICFLAGDTELDDAVAWFAHLRERPDRARSYETMKRDARAQHADPAAYRAAKWDWLQRQLGRLGEAA